MSLTRKRLFDNDGDSSGGGGGTIAGSGTTNCIPKFTPDGSTLGNSLIKDASGTTPEYQLLDTSNNVLGHIKTDSSANIFIGFNSGNSNIVSVSDGIDNTALGYGTLTANTTGRRNVAVGSGALNANTTGQINTAVGMGALGSNTTGSFNEAFGYLALGNNLIGTDNCAFGYLALQQCLDSFNTAMGHAALSVATNCQKNSAFGAYSQASMVSGYFNSSYGGSSLYNNTTGYGNCAYGLNSLFTNTAGDYNVAVGFGAGYYETGSNKLFIDNQFRASEADGRLKAMIYGEFAATTAGQSLFLNAQRISLRYLPTSSAGLTAGDIWNDSGVLKIA